MEFKGKNNKEFRGVVWMDYITKAEICDKSKVYLRCMKKIPILIMLDNGRIGYKEIEAERAFQDMVKSMPTCREPEECEDE